MASSSSGPPPPADGYGITDEMRNRAALGLDPYGAPGGDDGGRARGAYDGVPFDDALWSTDESTKGADDRHHGSKGRRAQQQHAAPRKTQLLDGAGKISLRAAAWVPFLPSLVSLFPPPGSPARCLRVGGCSRRGAHPA